MSQKVETNNVRHVNYLCRCSALDAFRNFKRVRLSIESQRLRRLFEIQPERSSIEIKRNSELFLIAKLRSSKGEDDAGTNLQQFIA
jgi:hypothetical protein